MRRTVRCLLIVGTCLLAVASVRLAAGRRALTPVGAQQTAVVAQATTNPGTPTAAAQTAQAGLTAIAATNPPPTASLPVPTITPAPIPLVSPVPTTRTGGVASGPATTVTGTTQTSGGGGVNGWAVAGIIVLLCTIAILAGAWYRMYRLRHGDE